MDQTRIETQRLIIETLTENDCNLNYLSWLQDQEVNQYLESALYQHNIEGIKQFVKEQSQHSLFVAIRIKENNKHIGNIKVSHPHPFHKISEYGIMMGDKTEWGKGYAKEATISIMNHCFGSLGVRKLCLGVIAKNNAALKMYQKLEFTIEGILKEHLYSPHEDKFLDVIRMAKFP